MDLAKFKDRQRQGWALFAPLETMTTPAAAHLVRYAQISAADKVLDVACGTGVVAVTAARLGAQVTGLDLAPVLLERARANGELAQLKIDWHEGDVEALPFADGSFDVVVSQFGHIFAPRPSVAIGEMLRVLKPGGRLAFASWPPELMMGRMFSLVAKYAPLPEGFAGPEPWGDPRVVRERLGNAVTSLSFTSERLLAPALTPTHFRTMMESVSPQLIALRDKLSPEAMARVRAEYDALVAEYWQNNQLVQDFLLTRARKA